MILDINSAGTTWITKNKILAALASFRGKVYMDGLGHSGKELVVF